MGLIKQEIQKPSDENSGEVPLDFFAKAQQQADQEKRVDNIQSLLSEHAQLAADVDRMKKRI